MERSAPSALVASPDSGFRETIAAAAELAGVRLVAQVLSHGQVAALLDALHPDLLVLDADSPGPDERERLWSFRHCNSGTAILMAASEMTDRRVSDGLLQGVCGFMTKNCGSREYANAMLAILRGEIWLGREKLAHAFTTLIDAINLPAQSRENGSTTERLSPREEEIVALITRGCTNKEIARALGLSDKTVKAHLSHIFAKLGVTRRAQLALQRNAPDASAAG